MVGGSEADFERARPLLEVMGKVIVHAGPVGHGQMVKLINNAVAATNASVLGQALLVGSRAGVDLDALVQVMGAGSGGSAMLDLKAGPMRRHDYTPLFKLEHMLKDVRLCLEEGQALGCRSGRRGRPGDPYRRHGPRARRRRLRRPDRGARGRRGHQALSPGASAPETWLEAAKSCLHPRSFDRFRSAPKGLICREIW